MSEKVVLSDPLTDTDRCIASGKRAQTNLLCVPRCTSTKFPRPRLLKIFVGRCLQLWIQASFLAMAFHSEGAGAKDKAATNLFFKDISPMVPYSCHQFVDVFKKEVSSSLWMYWKVFSIKTYVDLLYQDIKSHKYISCIQGRPAALFARVDRWVVGPCTGGCLLHR